jgi:hypothetical protein
VRQLEAPYLNLRRYTETGFAAPKLGLAGFFEIELVHIRTGLVVQRCRFRNLIVDAGLEDLGVNKPHTLLTYCAVGTGNSVPANTNISLDTEVGRTNASGGFADTAGTDPGDVYSWGKRTRVFTGAQANGNLTEVGMFRLSAGAPMWCRQLIRDGAGNPTTITKTSEYELRVVYELRYYPETTDVVTNTLINGANQNVTSRRSRWGDLSYWGPLNTFTNNAIDSTTFTGLMGTINGEPAGSLSKISVLGDPYVSGSRQITHTPTWGSTVSNGAIKSLATSTFRTFLPPTQYELTNVINKTDTQKLVAVFTSSWGRAVI